MDSKSNILQFSTAACDNNQGRLLIPERIVEARIAARLNQTELANAIGVTRQSISYYEKGDRVPDPDTMRSLAAALAQPLSFFTSEAAPDFGARSPNFFRKNGRDTKRRNEASNQFAAWLSQTAFTLTEYANGPNVDLPAFKPADQTTGRYSKEELEDCADETRKYFGLGWGPISNAVRLLEKHGVFVARLQIPDERIEAFSFWSGSTPFVFLASQKESAARARYDVCHELAHLVLHRSVSKSEIEDKSKLKAIEREADYFAGAFLLPRHSFPNEIYTPKLAAFLDLKRRWKVSIQAMVYRCKNLGIFDEDQTVNLYKQISFKKWRTQEPLDGPDGLPIEEPALMRRIVELVISSERFSVDDLKLKLGFSPRLIERLSGLPEGFLVSESNDEYDLSLK